MTIGAVTTSKWALAVAMLWPLVAADPARACDYSGDPRLLSKATHIFRARVLTKAANPQHLRIAPHHGWYPPHSFIGWLKVEKVYRGRLPHYIPYTYVDGNSCSPRGVGPGQVLYFVERPFKLPVRFYDYSSWPFSLFPDAGQIAELGRIGFVEQLRILRAAFPR
jgi:hypothetical protein